MPDRNLLLRALPTTMRDALKSRLRPADLNTGHVLFSSGDGVNSVYFLVCGAVSLVSELSDGAMIESAMVGRDSVVGAGAALDDRNAVYKAIVQVAARAFTLDIETARRLVRESEEFRTAMSAMKWPCWRRPSSRRPATPATTSTNAWRAGCFACARSPAATAST